jgi:phosphatidylinositol-3-phosphatase
VKPLPSGRIRPRAVAAVVLLTLVMGLGAFGSSRASVPAGVYFDYVVIIVLENHNLCDILTSCGGLGSYLTGLASSSALAREDHYCHVNPSLPNYLCLTGGSDFGCAGYDGGPNSNTCTGSAWTATNIVDRLENAGLSWKAYMEDMPTACSSSDSANGLYVVRHNPFLYYSDIATHPTRCPRILPSGTAGQALLDDLGSTSTASNYLWFTPNICNDMHDCSVATGDAYLGGLVPKILATAVFRSQRAALLVTFDEGNGQPIYTVWAGPAAKTGFSSSIPYDHYSILATVEANWNLAPLTANDRDAAKMSEFFIGQPSTGPPAPGVPGLPFVLTLAIDLLIGVAVVAGIAAFLILRRKRRSRERARQERKVSSGDPNDSGKR